MAGAGLQTKGEDHGVIAVGVGDLDHRVLKLLQARDTEVRATSYGGFAHGDGVLGVAEVADLQGEVNP